MTTIPDAARAALNRAASDLEELAGRADFDHVENGQPEDESVPGLNRAAEHLRNVAEGRTGWVLVEHLTPAEGTDDFPRTSGGATEGEAHDRTDTAAADSDGGVEHRQPGSRVPHVSGEDDRRDRSGDGRLHPEGLTDAAPGTARAGSGGPQRDDRPAEVVQEEVACPECAVPTPPRPFDRLSTVDPALASEVAGIVIDETAGFASLTDRYSIAVRVIELFEARTPAPQAEGDVREVDPKTLRHIGHVIDEARRVANFEVTDERDAMGRAALDAAVSSGLVVPVGEVERRSDPSGGWPHTIDLDGDPVSETDRIGRLLMKAYEAAEGRPVGVTYVATFADMARAVIADNENPRAALDVSMCPNCSTPQDCSGPHLPSLASTAIPARLLSGEHLGREVVLPSGPRIIVHFIEQLRDGRVRVHSGGFPHRLAPDDVVTLVDEEGRR